jgi:hypothetical protein
MLNRGKFGIHPHAFFTDLLRRLSQSFGAKPRPSFSIHPFNGAPNIRGSGQIQSLSASFTGLQEIIGQL